MQEATRCICKRSNLAKSRRLQIQQYSFCSHSGTYPFEDCLCSQANSMLNLKPGTMEDNYKRMPIHVPRKHSTHLIQNPYAGQRQHSCSQDENHPANAFNHADSLGNSNLHILLVLGLTRLWSSDAAVGARGFSDAGATLAGYSTTRVIQLCARVKEQRKNARSVRASISPVCTYKLLSIAHCETPLEGAQKSQPWKQELLTKLSAGKQP
eukprot:scaffold91187_cov22-Tisochrysis_lutea.AAC.1